MTEKNDPFSFPPFPAEQKPEQTTKEKHDLPVFPTGGSVQTPEPSKPASGESPLSDDELRDVRKILSDFRSGKKASQAASPEKAEDPFAFPPPGIPQEPRQQAPRQAQGRPPEPALAPTGSAGSPETKTMIMRAFDSRQVSASPETEAKSSFRTILNEISDLYMLVQIYGCVTGVFPVKDCIRHGTPEQKLFSLLAIGDRFLQGISGMALPQRKDLVRITGKYLSEVSEGFSFLGMENELFSPQYHERVDGSSSSGRLIREMRGFLIVRKNSEQVVRLGRVLT